MSHVDAIIRVLRCRCRSVTFWYDILNTPQIVKTSIYMSIQVKCLRICYVVAHYGVMIGRYGTTV